MSKFSSFKESKMLFENWRSHISEISSQVASKLAGMSDDEKEEMEGVLDSDDEEAGTTMQEQQIDTNLSPDEKTQKMLEILRSMSDDDPDCFDKALRALSKLAGKQGVR